MTDAPASDADAVIAASLADLAANAPAETIVARLRSIEGEAAKPPLRHARFLRARAIATQRLGFPDAALGDLYDACATLSDEAEWRERSNVFREIANVQIWCGDAREASLALLRAAAESSLANDRVALASGFAAAGRLSMEIRRPRDAQAMLAAASAIAGEDWPITERCRVAVNRLQALVAAQRFDEARTALAELPTLLTGATPRLRMLAEIERVRIAYAAGDLNEAHAALDRATALAPTDPESFEHVEIAEAAAELAFAEKDFARAAALIDTVVTRDATDNLAGREVVARLLQARILDALDKPDDAERTLAAALRRASARGLRAHADEVRSAIATRGGSERIWLPDHATNAPIAEEMMRRFVRRSTLGAGGFASVVRAYDLELGVEVALKRSNLENIFDPAARQRLLDAARTEVSAGSRIEHPGVARIHGMLVDGDREALLIEEFVEGETLRAALPTIDTPRGLDLLARLSYALAAVHAAGVVHRDFKPDNVILRPGGTPVLVDFGIALVGRKREKDLKGGTPFYMAPEQAAGQRTDERTDLYALGVVACELLLKTRPEPEALSLAWLRSGRSARERRLATAGLTPEVARLIATLLAPHPRWRPRSAGLVGAQFAEAATAAGHG
jgi:tetratricopeptide (TPR) repeat protein